MDIRPVPRLRAGSLPIFALLSLGCAGALSAQQPSLELRVTDLSPRFLTFYEQALAESADPDRRWALWKELYNFAALPPVPEKDSLARALLDAAWTRYPGVIERIRAGVPGMEPDPEPIFHSVADLLGLDSPLTVSLLGYVGGLERNAFFLVGADGVPTVALPIEEDAEWRTLALTHELTHAVHSRLGSRTGSWERSIAQTLFDEGLANRVEEALFPGLGAEAYVEHADGWYRLAETRREAILEGILPWLESGDSETVMRFTLGTGTTDTHREAYYVGWLVVGRLLEEGWSFARLARVEPSELTRLVGKTIRVLLAEA